MSWGGRHKDSEQTVFAKEVCNMDINQSAVIFWCLSIRRILAAMILCATNFALIALANPSQHVLNLNGNGDYVMIPSAPELQSSNAITIEAWIYPIDNTNIAYACFIAKGVPRLLRDNRQSPMTYGLYWGQQGYWFSFYLYFGQIPGAFLEAPAAVLQWTHIAVTYDSDSGLFALYTNGIAAAYTTNDMSGMYPLKGQKTRQTDLPLMLGSLYTQNYAHSLNSFATGQMDEVRIWDRALSGQEILRNFCRRLSGTESNLVAYWNFDDQTFNDGTKNQHNGTMGGNAQIVRMQGFDIIHGLIGFAGTTFDRNGQVTMNILSINGITLRIDGSTNLIDWQTVGAVQNTEGTIQFFDADALKFKQRFYRAVLP